MQKYIQASYFTQQKSYPLTRLFCWVLHSKMLFRVQDRTSKIRNRNQPSGHPRKDQFTIVSIKMLSGNVDGTDSGPVPEWLVGVSCKWEAIRCIIKCQKENSRQVAFNGISDTSVIGYQKDILYVYVSRKFWIRQAVNLFPHQHKGQGVLKEELKYVQTLVRSIPSTPTLRQVDMERKH